MAAETLVENSTANPARYFWNNDVNGLKLLDTMLRFKVMYGYLIKEYSLDIGNWENYNRAQEGWEGRNSKGQIALHSIF